MRLDAYDLYNRLTGSEVSKPMAQSNMKKKITVCVLSFEDVNITIENSDP